MRNLCSVAFCLELKRRLADRRASARREPAEARAHVTPNAGETRSTPGLVSRERLDARRLVAPSPLQCGAMNWNRQADRARRRFDRKFRVNDARRVFRYDANIPTRSER